MFLVITQASIPHGLNSFGDFGFGILESKVSGLGPREGVTAQLRRVSQELYTLMHL